MGDEQPTTEQKPLPTGKSILEGSAYQFAGTNLAGLWVLDQASKGHYYQAGYEVYLAGCLGIAFYVVGKLFGQRIMRWAKSE